MNLRCSKGIATPVLCWMPIPGECCGLASSRGVIRPFFEELGPEDCAHIEAVAMDMNTVFDLRFVSTVQKHGLSTTSSMWWPNMAEK